MPPRRTSNTVGLQKRNATIVAWVEDSEDEAILYKLEAEEIGEYVKKYFEFNYFYFQNEEERSDWIRSVGVEILERHNIEYNSDHEVILQMSLVLEPL